MQSTTMFIHVGYHKTGSTFLQNLVFPRLPLTYVPLTEDDNLDLVASSDCRAEVLRGRIDATVARAAHAGVPGVALISNELLSGHPHGHESFDPFVVADNLHAAYPDARIIVCIRNQFDYLLSIYAFRVAIKGYEHRGLTRFVREEGERGLLAKLEYDKLIRHYMELFGKERVLVLPLELLRDRSTDFLQRLEHFLGVTIPSDINLGRHVNESTRLVPVLRFWRPFNYVFGHALRIVRLLDRGRRRESVAVRVFRLSYYRFKRSVTPLLNRLFAGSEKLDIRTMPDYGALTARYARSNALLEALIREPLSTLRYPSNERT